VFACAVAAERKLLQKFVEIPILILALHEFAILNSGEIKTA
jgi:hypothetical protein